LLIDGDCIEMMSRNANLMLKGESTKVGCYHGDSGIASALCEATCNLSCYCLRQRMSCATSRPSSCCMPRSVGWFCWS
jgi:hypothetical protein